MQKSNKVKKESAVIKADKNGMVIKNGLAIRANLRYPETITMVYVLLMFTVFPLTINFNTQYTDITTHKYDFFTFFTVLLMAAVGLMAAMFSINEKYALKRGGELGGEGLNLPQIFALAYLGAGIISAMLSPYALKDMWMGINRHEGLGIMFLYVGVFFAVSLYGEYNRFYVYGFGAAMLLVSLLGFFQAMGAKPLGLDIFTYFQKKGSMAFLSTIGNIDLVSGMLSLGIPIVAGGYVLLKDNRKYFLLMPAFVAMVYILQFIGVDSGRVAVAVTAVLVTPLLLTDVKKLLRVLELGIAACITLALERSFNIVGYLILDEAGAADRIFALDVIAKVLLCVAGAMAAAWFVLAVFFRKKALPKKAVRTALYILIAVVLVFAVIWLYNYDGQRYLIKDISALLHGELDDRAGSYRGFIWKRSIETIKQNPVFGTGPDTFVQSFAQHNMEFQQKYNPNIYYDNAHNDFLQIGVNLGLVGLAAYLGFVLTFAAAALKSVDKNPLVLIFAGAAMCYLIHSFFSFSICIVSPVFWICMGLAQKLMRQQPQQAKKTDLA